MKTLIAFVSVIGIVVIVAFAGVGINSVKKSNQEFLRLHVRANSNTQYDQDAKNIVRQSVVNELTPIFYNVESKEAAMYKLRDNLPIIEKAANDALSKNGYLYKALVAIKSEVFPTRSYTTQDVNLTLPEGLYDALILELGEGKGDNWWCCIYPPLCFLENNTADGVKYKSKILELFNQNKKAH